MICGICHKEMEAWGELCSKRVPCHQKHCPVMEKRDVRKEMDASGDNRTQEVARRRVFQV